MHGSDGPLTTELDVAVAAAEAAGVQLADAFRSPIAARGKGRFDAVTEWDGVAETVIMRRLADAFPNDARIGEESGRARPDTSGAGIPPREWIVDPLDGTVNFGAGIPYWCVSVALAVGNAVVLGVVHDPLRRQSFVAIRGGGAWTVNPRQALASRGTDRIADAVIDAYPGDPGDPRAVTAVSALHPWVRASRSLGSVALSMVALAAGQLDGVVQIRGLGVVDVAAAALIAVEADVIVTDPTGQPFVPRPGASWDGGIVAASRGLHADLLRSMTNG